MDNQIIKTLMGIVNFGIVKAIVSNKFTDALVESTDSSFKKKNINEFVEILKSSKLLETEFTVYTNLESKTITNPNLAIKYIDESISLMKKYSLVDFIAEHKKIEKFHDEDVIFLDKEKTKIFESIHNLIVENLQSEAIPNVDTIHESFSAILDHITTEKKKETITESTISFGDFDADEIVEVAISKFNERFSNLSESEQTLLKTLTFSSDEEKTSLFESLRINGLSKLNALLATSIHQDKVNESIEKVKTMKFDKDTLLNDIIKLDALNRL